MLQSDLMGFKVRSRFKQNAEEERASIFHAAKELSNAQKSITCLKVGGVTVDNQNKIKMEILSYTSVHFSMPIMIQTSIIQDPLLSLMILTWTTF